MNKEVENWRRSSHYDFEAAGGMLSTGHYVYVVFLCHLAIEKMLKAVIAQQIRKAPPKTHNLRLLLDKAQLRPPNDMLTFISELTEASVATRYPLDFQAASESYTQEVAQNCLDRTRKVLEWIETSLKQ